MATLGLLVGLRLDGLGPPEGPVGLSAGSVVDLDAGLVGLADIELVALGHLQTNSKRI